MAQQDKTFNFQGVGIEVHIGNPQGSSGTNPLPPVDAPIISPKIQGSGPGGTILSKTVGSSRFQNPA